MLSVVDRLRAQIAARLVAQGARQIDLADHFGMSSAWISQVLKGKRGIRLDLIDQIAAFFGVLPATLLDDPSDPSLDPYAIPLRIRQEGPHNATTAAHARDLARAAARRVRKIESDNAAYRAYIQFLRDALDDARALARPLCSRLDDAAKRSPPRAQTSPPARRARPIAARRPRDRRIGNR